MNQVKDEITQNRKRPWVIKLILPVIIVAVLAFGVFLSIKIAKYYVHRTEQKSREFLVQIIESVNDQTDFYKERTHAMDRREIDINRDKFSEDYEIKLIDRDLGHYEYKVTFDEENELLIIVIMTEDGGWCSHVHFRNPPDE